MAKKLGLERHIQHPGSPKEHLDVSQSKRTEALRLGAVEMDGRKMVELVQARRDADRQKTDGKDADGKDAGRRET